LTILCLQVLFSDAFSSLKHRPVRATKLSVLSDATAEWRSFNKTEELAEDAISASASSTKDVCTVQILMSDTGGGHRASANALRDALEALHPGQFECEIVDIYMDYGPIWPFNDVVRMYKLMAEYSWTWDLFFRFGETDLGLKLQELTLNTICYEPFRNCLQKTFESSGQRADIVVSVHPLCQDLPLQILEDLDVKDENGGNGIGFGMGQQSQRKTPFVTVVTDLGGAHKTWFNPDVDKCFVPSNALNQKAQSRGLVSSQIVQHGLPIRKGFWPQELQGSTSTEAPQTTTELRTELGLQQDLPTVLVVGGGDGMGGIVDIASALGQKLGADSNTPEYQMVVVCGSNQGAKNMLQKTNWPKGVSVQIQGYVNNMDAWMKASDCLVTKAGPGTIAEASICGLPCMLFAYLPGQEEGNIPFVENSGFGKYSSDPNEIANTVTSWLQSPSKIESLKKASLEAARPSATLDIAKEVAKIAFERKKFKNLRP